MQMKKNDRTEVLIEGYSSEGYGVAKPDGYVLFIPETQTRRGMIILPTADSR